jgi:6,7-dimethyl-8-ribityllumazine synthase
MTTITTLEGDLRADGDERFALVASRFNHFIVDRLVDGAIDTLVRHGVPAKNLVLVKTPGAWELPVAVKRLTESGKFDAVIVLSAVIRGSTPHFDFVAGEATKGVAHSMMTTGVPVSFGVLTTDSIEQAIERAGTKAGNKGADAALAALEMVRLGRTLTSSGY